MSAPSSAALPNSLEAVTFRTGASLLAPAGSGLTAMVNRLLLGHRNPGLARELPRCRSRIAESVVTLPTPSLPPNLRLPVGQARTRRGSRRKSEPPLRTQVAAFPNPPWVLCEYLVPGSVGREPLRVYVPRVYVQRAGWKDVVAGGCSKAPRGPSKHASSSASIQGIF